MERSFSASKKLRTLFAVGVLTLILAPAVFVMQRGTRSVRPLLSIPIEGPAHFDPARSAALFVGVQHFDDQAIHQIPYAVDDAVDLAWELALNSNVHLVAPRRVVLLLSGKPRKLESQGRLQDLIAKGAVVDRHADQEKIVRQLHRQAKAVEKDGLFIVAFATHGYNSPEGVPYVLTESSVLDRPESAISTAAVLETVSKSKAHRSLVFLDACRDRLTAGDRGGRPSLSSAAPIIEGMTRAEGQVVFYAAAAGGYAYDDERRRNGVFTAAVVDGLRCEADHDIHGLVTVDTLSAFVEGRVRSWVKKNRNATIGSATQLSADGATRSMPLADCSPTVPPTPLRQRPARVVANGTSLEVFDEEGQHLWTKQLPGTVAHAEVGDLDEDDTNEVIAGIGRGAAAGRIMVFNAAGDLLWSANTNGPPNYDARGAGGMVVQTFAISDPYRKYKREIVVLSVDENGRYPSRLSILSRDGKLRAAYSHPGLLQTVVIARQGSHNGPRIIVAAVNHDLAGQLNISQSVASVFMLDPKDVSGEAPPYRGKFTTGSQLWYGVVLPATQTITALRIVEPPPGRPGKRQREIALETSSGNTIRLDFAGRVVATDKGSSSRSQAQFELIAPH